MRRAVTIGFAALLAMAGCGDDPPTNTQAAYCTAATANKAALTAPAMSSPADLAATLEMYRAMHATAPLAVEPEWAVMEALVRSAADTDPADAGGREKLAEASRRAKTAADRIVVYTQRLCGVLIGTEPVTSVPLVAPPSTKKK